MKTTQTLYLNDPKKHSVRYDSAPSEENPMLTSVYVGKKALPQPWPTVITVTVEAIDA